MPQDGRHSLSFPPGRFPRFAEHPGRAGENPGGENKKMERGSCSSKISWNLERNQSRQSELQPRLPRGSAAVTRSGQAGTRGRGERGHQGCVTPSDSPWGCQRPPAAAPQHRQSREKIPKSRPNPACPRASFPLEATSCPPARSGDFATGLDGPLISDNLINYPAASSPKQSWVSRR